MKKNILTLTVLFLLIYGCQQVKESDGASVQEDITKVLMEQESAWNKGDLEGYMQEYWHSDSLRFASGNRVTFGWEQTLRNYKKAYPDKTAMGKLEFSEIDIQIINDKSAVAFGRWKLIREKDEPKGLFTLVFNKKKGYWRIIHDHTSSGK